MARCACRQKFESEVHHIPYLLLTTVCTFLTGQIAVSSGSVTEKASGRNATRGVCHEQTVSLCPGPKFPDHTAPQIEVRGCLRFPGGFAQSDKVPYLLSIPLRPERSEHFLSC